MPATNPNSVLDARHNKDGLCAVVFRLGFIPGQSAKEPEKSLNKRRKNFFLQNPILKMRFLKCFIYF